MQGGPLHATLYQFRNDSSPEHVALRNQWYVSGMVLMCSLLLGMRYIYKRLAAATSGESKLCTRKAYKHELPIPETPFPSHIKNGVPQNPRAGIGGDTAAITPKSCSPKSSPSQAVFSGAISSRQETPLANLRTPLFVRIILSNWSDKMPTCRRRFIPLKALRVI